MDDEHDRVDLSLGAGVQSTCLYLILRGLRGVPYLHASRKPLDQVHFDESHQLNLFGNDCAGVCGV